MRGLMGVASVLVLCAAPASAQQCYRGSCGVSSHSVVVQQHFVPHQFQVPRQQFFVPHQFQVRQRFLPRVFGSRSLFSRPAMIGRPRLGRRL